jgi:hypothetical protein
VVFVHRLAKVAPLLLVPPVGVGIAKLALDARGVDVAAVLREIVSPKCPLPVAALPPIARTISGSSSGVSVG